MWHVPWFIWYGLFCGAVSAGAHFIFLYCKWGVSRNICWTLRAGTSKFRLLCSSFVDISPLRACLTRFLLSMADSLESASGHILVLYPMRLFRKFCTTVLERLSCLAMAFCDRLRRSSTRIWACSSLEREVARGMVDGWINFELALYCLKWRLYTVYGQ